MVNLNQRIFLIIPALLFSMGITAQSGYNICLKTFKTTQQLKTLSYRMEKRERIEGSMKIQISDSKLIRSPYSVYAKQNSPNDGVEILYVEGKNDNKALVNPNGFPWVNLNMLPNNSIMRKDQHHSIKDAGFDLLISILEYLFNKYGDETEPMVTLEGSGKCGSMDCWIITFNNPNYKIENYTVKKDESIFDIASARKLSEYQILQLNSEEVSDYNDIEENQVIRIPNDYSPKMTIFIDKVRQIPLKILVYDNKGLYENYTYSKVVLNPQFPSNAFDKHNKEYNF